MTSCIIGPGAMGSALAYYLSRADSVVCVVRSAEKASSLTLHVTPDNQELTLPKVPWQQLWSLEGPIFICVKANDLADVTNSIQRYLPAGKTIVVLANGINIYADALSALGARYAVIRGITYFGALKSGHSLILSGRPRITLGDEGRFAEQITSVAEYLSQAQIETTLTQDVVDAEWRKAIANIVINGVCTLADRPNGQLVADPSLQKEGEELFLEGVAVARREGHQLSNFTYQAVLDTALATASNINSTLAAVRAKQPTEALFLWGRLQQLGEKHCIPTPRSTHILKALSTDSPLSPTILSTEEDG